MGSRVYFMFYYFIPILSCLSSKGASHNAEGGSISYFKRGTSKCGTILDKISL